MTAAAYNLTIDQGSDFALDLVVKEDNVAKDLTGYSARAQMRNTKGASTVSATFTCTVEGTEMAELSCCVPYTR